MQFTNTLFGAVALAAATVSATTIKVTVGSADGKSLTYTPNDITADVGTLVEFTFLPKNHTVTQSSFGDPCHPLDGGFFSGFNPTKSVAPNTFTITVKDPKPIWFYCSQTKGDHCQKGMVGAINAPKSGKTLAAFTLAASNASTSTFPPTGVVGGFLTPVSNATVTGTTTTGAGSTATSTSSTFTGAATAMAANILSGGAAVAMAALAML